MVIYKDDQFSVAAPAVTGAVVKSSSYISAFQPWQPSTWPQPPDHFNEEFIGTLRIIFNDSMLGEIDNVIGDIKRSNGDLQHRGHVVAIALLCALDAISYYGYRDSDDQIPEFVKAHFPDEYRPYAKELLILYRHIMAHRWNLFRAALLPGNDPIRDENGTLCFGLLHFRDALRLAAENFLEKLKSDATLQANAIWAYGRLRRSAKA
jgi:hypothetical protein